MPKAKTAEQELERIVKLHDRAFAALREKIVWTDLAVVKATPEELKVAVDADIGTSAQALEMVRLALEGERAESKIVKPNEGP